ncbi:hypothetical protein D3C76_1808250 [compost metagenome]
MICASVNGMCANCLAENALVWSLACADAASLDCEKANNPRAWGPLSVKLTSCK